MTDGERLVYLILGNIGDEVALKNICEAHSIEMEEIDDREKEFLIHTNQFCLEKCCLISSYYSKWQGSVCKSSYRPFFEVK